MGGRAQATVESLAQLDGPGSLLGAIKVSLAAATAPVHPVEAETRTATLVRQMRLQVCRVGYGFALRADHR